MINKAFILAVSTIHLVVSPTCANTQTRKNNSLRFLTGKPYVKHPLPPTGYYGPAPHPPVVYYPPPPISQKLVEAKVLTGKSKFLAQTGVGNVVGFGKVIEGMSSEVKAALSLIEEAKFKLEYGHKDYSCDLLELSESLIEAAVAQIAHVPKPFLPLGLEKLKAATAKIEAHIKWSSAQYGYGYKPKQGGKTALDALNLAVAAFEDTIALALPILVGVVNEAATALAGADSLIKEALKYCNEENTKYGNYYKDNYDLIAYFEKALMVAHDSVKAADETLDALNAAPAEIAASFQNSVAAVEHAFQAIVNAITYKKEGYN